MSESISAIICDMNIFQDAPAIKQAKIEENKHLEKIVSYGHCDGIGSELFIARIKELKGDK